MASTKQKRSTFDIHVIPAESDSEFHLSQAKPQFAVSDFQLLLAKPLRRVKKQQFVGLIAGVIPPRWTRRYLPPPHPSPDPPFTPAVVCVRAPCVTAATGNKTGKLASCNKSVAPSSWLKEAV